MKYLLGVLLLISLAANVVLYRNLELSSVRAWHAYNDCLQKQRPSIGLTMEDLIRCNNYAVDAEEGK